MENVAISRRNHKKGNKENAQPVYGKKSFIKSNEPSTVPFQLKNYKKDDAMSKNGALKTRVKPVDTMSASGEVLKKVKLVPTAATATDVKQRQTHSKAVPAEQAVKDRKMVADVPKAPAALPSSKSAPGMYKGKIVQSKIGSIWKSSATTTGGADPKPSVAKPEHRRVGNVTQSRSKSVTDLPKRGAQNPTQTRSKSVFDRPAPVSRPAVTSRPPAGSYSARPTARTIPATLTSTSSKNTVALTKTNGTRNPKPRVPVTDMKVSSSLSQYRLTMETAEERRAKLAGWLASKGKTFKRPAMTAAPTKTTVSANPKPDHKPQIVPNKCKPDCESSPVAHRPDSAATAVPCADTQRIEAATHSQTPVIMNTTLDLLENSDADLPVDPQDGVDDIVVNLCDALDAMETPSQCSNELSQVTDLCSDVQVGAFKAKDEMSEEASTHPKVEQVNDGEEECDESEAETDDEEGQSDDCVMKTPPKTDASLVKYSVKTTPYLQSVKKTIEDDASTSVSKRKSNIKDLKFLTPVRRSCRIQRNSSCLPTMLLDHDPCVSSLAELVKLDENPNAYIYRKNPALLED